MNKIISFFTLFFATSVLAQLWPVRFVEWIDDFGFLDAPGVPTQAAQEVAAFEKKISK